MRNPLPEGPFVLRTSYFRADGFGGLDGAAAREDGQAPEEGALVLVQQGLAPGDRGAEGPLARGEVGRAAGQHRQPARQPGEQRRRRQQRHARGGELERQRQAVQPGADRGDGARVGGRGGEVR
ncbi:MAG TPA: hypothetical protein VFW96_27925, partial [Thermomicrobiales bacterium]|nr:hypothetical protein [Thermomicrobiales bacterium]